MAPLFTSDSLTVSELLSNRLAAAIEVLITFNSRLLTSVFVCSNKGFPGGANGKEPASQRRRCGFDPWVGKISGSGHGNSLQYSCLENPVHRGAWWAMAQRVARS